MMKKRILMIGWEYPPRIIGGLAIASRGIARALGKLGHKILMILPRITGNEPKDKNIVVIGINSRFLPLTREEFLNFIIETMHIPSLSVYQSKLLKLKENFIKENDIYFYEEILETQEKIPFLEGGYGKNLFYEIQIFAEFVAKIASKIKKSIDIIHAHDWITYPAALYARYLTSKPLVLHVHATEFDRSGDHPNQYVYDLEKYSFQQADAIITVSNYTKNLIIEKYQIYPDKIFPVYNAIEFKEEYREVKIKKPIRQKIVLFVGRITFQKGPDYFVRAAKKVIEEIQNVKFLMVGSGDMYARMIEMAADLGVGKYFHYTGFIDREKIDEVFKMSDVYVLPSVSEPFGLTVLEALKSGVPVIVSKQSGVAEVVQNAIKVDFWDVEDIARNIIKLLKDPELKQEILTKTLTEDLQKLSWEESAKRVEEVYEYVLKKKQYEAI